MTKRDRVLELLEKLQRLADTSRNNSPKEAEAAAARMQALMTEYQISQLEIGDSETEEVDPVVHRTVMEELGLKTKLVGWKSVLCNGLCKANSCQMVYSPARQSYQTQKMYPGRVYLFGKSDNLETVIYMFQYLSGEVERLAKMLGDREFTIGGKGRKAWGNAFRLGCASGLYTRLVNTRRVIQDKCPQETQALIRKEDVKIDSAVKEAFGKLSSSSAYTCSDWQGYDSGKQAAENIHLGGQDRALGGSRKQLRD